MRTVTHHGRTTAYRWSDRGGERPPILFVHGAGSSHRVWKSQFRLADDGPVAALDLSGHGESEDVAAEAGYEARSAYVDDVLAVQEETGARILVGCSLGGAVLMTLALERDVPLDGLVFVATGAKLSVLDDLMAWLNSDFDRALDFLHDDDRLFHAPDEGYAEVSREVLRDTGREVVYRDFLTCHTFDVRDRIAEIDVPALAVVGEYDQLTPPWYHEYLAEELPDCGLALVDDAAHLVMLERPTPFNGILAEFVRRLRTGTH